jgi:hypothetical protein
MKWVQYKTKRYRQILAERDEARHWARKMKAERDAYMLDAKFWRTMSDGYSIAMDALLKAFDDSATPEMIEGAVKSAEKLLR